MDVEIDLSVALDDFSAPGHPAARSDREAPSPVHADDIEGAFEQLRAEAAQQSPADVAAAQYKLGLALRDAGRIDEAITALQNAARGARVRFYAASELGRIYRNSKLLPQAIDWLERAAEAPAPTADEAHMLLYELAELLESVGEVARALAVCLELQSEAGEYRDVAARIDRLAKVQTRG